MKRIGIFGVVVVVFLGLVFFGLKFTHQKKVTTAPKPLSKAVYVNTMLSLADKVKNITSGKLICRNKVVTFVPKKDAFGNAVAVNYYSAEKKLLEDVKVAYLASVPIEKYSAISKMFLEVLDNDIAAYNKAIEALEKDDPTIMDKERAPLLKKGEQLLFQVIQALQEIKMRPAA